MDRPAGCCGQQDGVELGSEHGGDVEQREVVASSRPYRLASSAVSDPPNGVALVASELGHEQGVAAGLREHEVGISVVTELIQQLRDLAPSQALQRHGSRQRRTA